MDALAGPGIVLVGHGGALAAARVVAVANPRSAPIQRAAQAASGAGRVVDLTYGRRVRSVWFLDTGQLVLTALSPEAALARWQAALAAERARRAECSSSCATTS